MKLEEILKLIQNINETKEKLSKAYDKKINVINEKIEKLQNSKDKSPQYIEDQKNKLQKQLDEIMETQKKKLEQVGDNIINKIMQMQTKATYDQTRNIASRFGVRMPDINV